MRLNRSTLAAVAAGMVIGSVGGAFLYAAAFSSPTPQVPELKVIDQFSGLWSGQSSSPGQQPNEVQGSADWVLGGRFLVTKNTVAGKDGPFESWTVWGYDTIKKEFHRTVFTSMGIVLNERGQWNEGEKKFTFSVDGVQGLTGTATAKVVDDRTRAWTYEFKNATGQVTGQLSGTNTRR